MERSTSQTTDKKSTAGQEKSSYRPVSNLSFISKIVEKVTLIQFAKHCDENRLLSTYQSAYGRNHSSETCLVKLVDDLLWAKEEHLVTAVVILDLSAAFDTVDYDLLLGSTGEEIWSHWQYQTMVPQLHKIKEIQGYHR